MAARRVQIRDEGGNHYGVLWVSFTQDCNHDIFQINFKHRNNFHTFTSYCETCGIRTNVEVSREVLETINGVRRHFGLAEV